MNFLSPWFLFGAAAIALPVAFHLIRRATKERTRFSSLMFLLPTPPKLDRRSRIEHWLLLLLRCLVLLLLAAAFARPFFEKSDVPGKETASAKRMVVLLDTSASMRRSGIWTEAKAKLESIVRNTAVADEVVVCVFDRSLRTVVSFEQWSQTAAGDRLALVLGQIDQVEPGWQGTQLGRSLLGAVDLLEDAARQDQNMGRSPSVVVISDMQQGAKLDGLQGHEWPHGLTVDMQMVGLKKTFNAGIFPLAETSEAVAAGNSVGVRVRVTSAADASREQLKLGWADASGRIVPASAVDLYLPAGQTRTVALTNPPAGVAERIVLTGDDEPFDNIAYVVPPRPVESHVVYWGAEKDSNATEPLYFLRRAFPETPWQRVLVQQADPAKPLDESMDTMATLSVVAAPLKSDASTRLRKRLQEGRTAVLVVRGAEMGATLGALLDAPSVSLQPTTGGYALLGQIDFTHPLFAPFADPRYSDFTKMQFWHHWKLNLESLPKARVVARFDNGDPALVQVPVGAGTLLVLTAGWQPSDSQLALSSKFVPLLQALLEMAGAQVPTLRTYVVGDEITLPRTSGGAEWVVIKPDGQAVRTPSGTAFTGADQPGIYTVNGVGATWRFAVNVSPEESRTARIAEDEWARLGLPVTGPVQSQGKLAEVKRQRRATELEAQQKLWRGLLALALVLLVLETTVSGWLSRRPVAQPEVTA